MFSDKNFKIICIAGFIFSLMQSCKTSSTDACIKWTQNIKEKILQDASAKPDRSEFDSVHLQWTFFKADKKLKQISLAPRKDQPEGEKTIYDTAMIVYYSADQNFQFIQQPCIFAAERSYEGVTYKFNRYGYAVFNYCNRKIKETGFYNNNLNVGVWSKDSAGAVVSQKDFGGLDALEKTMTDLKYSR